MDPALSLGGRRGLLVSVAEDQAAPPNQTSGVVIAHTDDGAVSWQDAKWVQQGQPNLGCGSDAPWIASNPVFPFDTWVVWDQRSNLGGDDTTRMRRVWYDTNTPPQLHADPHLQVVDNGAAAHTLAFGALPPGCTSGGAGVFVLGVTSTSNFERCEYGTVGRMPGTTVTYWLSVYDTGFCPTCFGYPWYGGPIATTTVDHCLGNDATVGNMERSTIAVEPNTSHMWIPMTSQTPYGVHAEVREFALVCDAGGRASVVPGGVWTSPPVRGQPPGQYRDEWQPSVAVSRINGVPRAVVYWYGTRTDPNNFATATYMSFQEAYGSFSPPARIAWGAGVPWAHSYACPPPACPLGVHVNPMWDYQQLAPDFSVGSTGHFLAVWAWRHPCGRRSRQRTNHVRPAQRAVSVGDERKSRLARHDVYLHRLHLRGPDPEQRRGAGCPCRNLDP